MTSETRMRVLIAVTLTGCLAWFVAAAVLFGMAQESERHQQADGSVER